VAANVRQHGAIHAKDIGVHLDTTAGYVDAVTLKKDQQNYFFFFPPLTRDSAGPPVPLTFSGVAGLSGCLPASRATRFEGIISLTSHLIHREYES